MTYILYQTPPSAALGIHCLTPTCTSVTATTAPAPPLTSTTTAIRTATVSATASPLATPVVTPRQTFLSRLYAVAAAALVALGLPKLHRAILAPITCSARHPQVPRVST